MGDKSCVLKENEKFSKKEVHFMSHKIQHLMLAHFASHGVFLLNFICTSTAPHKHYIVWLNISQWVWRWLWQLCIQVGDAIVHANFWMLALLNLKKAEAAVFLFSYVIFSLCSWKCFSKICLTYSIYSIWNYNFMGSCNCITARILCAKNVPTICL